MDAVLWSTLSLAVLAHPDAEGLRGLKRAQRRRRRSQPRVRTPSRAMNGGPPVPPPTRQLQPPLSSGEVIAGGASAGAPSAERPADASGVRPASVGPASPRGRP